MTRLAPLSFFPHLRAGLTTLCALLLAAAIAPGALSQSGGIIGTGAPGAVPNLGVVGTVTEFGSVIVNELRIQVRPDQLKDARSGQSLQRGQRVLIKVHKTDQGLQAVELRALPKLTGQVGSDGQHLTLLRKRLVGALEGPTKARVEAKMAALQPGQWVAVDAIQIGDSDLLLGALEVIAPPPVVAVSGILSLEAGTSRFLVGGQPIVLSRKATRGMPFMRTDVLGRQVRVEGKMRPDGTLVVISFDIDPIGEALKQDRPLEVELEGSYQRDGGALVVSSDIARLRVPAQDHPRVIADQGPALIKARLLPTGLLQIVEVRPWQPARPPAPPPQPRPQPQGYWYFDGLSWYFMPIVNWPQAHVPGISAQGR